MTTTPANERNDSERMSKLEGAYEQVNERLGDMNGLAWVRMTRMQFGRIDGTATNDHSGVDTVASTNGLRTDMDARFHRHR